MKSSTAPQDERRTGKPNGQSASAESVTCAAGSDSTAADGGASPAASSSSRHTARFESSVTRLADAVEKSDKAQLEVLELSAGVMLEHVIQNHGTEVPEGDDPYTFATVAGSVARVDSSFCENAAGHTDSDENIIFGFTYSDTGDDGGLNPEDWEVPEEWKSYTDIVLVPRTTTTLVKYDAEFAKSVLSVKVDRVPEPPLFPGFELETDFFQWVHDNVFTEDVVETSTIFGTTTPRTYRRLTTAMTAIHGLPRFTDRVRDGEFTYAHLEVAADLCQTVAFRFMPKLDEYLSLRRADVTCETLRTALRKKIQLLQPEEDRAEVAAKRRRVEVDTFKNGSACLSVTGPAAEIHAAFQRIQAMARAVYAGQANTFNLAPGVEIVDERGISALMCDILLRPQPKLSVKVKVTDPVTGMQSTRESSLLDEEGNLLFDSDAQGVSGLVDCGNETVPPATDNAFSSGAIPETVSPEYDVVIAMPTDQWWLANQAAVVATVPFLTLTGDSELPGTVGDGSPIPAETARRIAAGSKTLTRILTDPATGTPVDAKATTYTIPKSVRKTLIAQWAICTVPGCTRSAEKSEIDHVEPFFHLDPLKGGLTRFGNLHPLCKKHHAVKTARNYTVRMPESGLVEYEFTHGVSTTVHVPDQPINVEQALEFHALFGIGLKRWRIPKEDVPPPKYVLELMPGETTIRARDEAIRREEEAAAEKRRLQENYERGRVARRKLMIARMLDWGSAVFQPCLPAGSDSVTMKRLPRGRRTDRYGGHTRRRNRPGQPSKLVFVFTDRKKQKVRSKVKWEHDLAVDPPPF